MPRTPSPVQEISRAAIHKRAQRAVSLSGATCSKCGSPNCLERHHEDYSKPVDVAVLCSHCHGLEHKELVRVACAICKTLFQPARGRRSTLCGNPSCLRELGKQSAAKRWKAEATDCARSAMASYRRRLGAHLSYCLGGLGYGRANEN